MIMDFNLSLEINRDVGDRIKKRAAYVFIEKKPIVSHQLK